MVTYKLHNSTNSYMILHYMSQNLHKCILTVINNVHALYVNQDCNMGALSAMLLVFDITIWVGIDDRVVLKFRDYISHLHLYLHLYLPHLLMILLPHLLLHWLILTVIAPLPYLLMILMKVR